MTFTANVFQLKKPVGIGNDVLKESITKPGADLQRIVATLNKPNQIACVESEVSGVSIESIIFIIEEDESIGNIVIQRFFSTSRETEFKKCQIADSSL